MNNRQQLKRINPQTILACQSVLPNKAAETTYLQFGHRPLYFVATVCTLALPETILRMCR